MQGTGREESRVDIQELMGLPGVLPDDPGRNSVLVVDDDMNQRMVTIRILRKQGYECSGAASTREAKQQLRAKAFGLLVTDLRMFEEDGIELVRHVSDHYPDTSSIVVTGFVSPNGADVLRRAGACAVLPKPLDRDAFVPVVTEAMEKRKASFELRRHRSG